MKEFKLPNIEEEQSVLKTIRLKQYTLNKNNELSKQTNVSVNRLLNEFIEYALNNLTDSELNKFKDKKDSNN